MKLGSLEKHDGLCVLISCISGIFVCEYVLPYFFVCDFFFFFSSRRRHTSCSRDWSSDVCSSDLGPRAVITDYASRYPMIQLLDNPERTTPHALNLGIARARGRIIMRMDAHAAYPTNYIADLVDCMERTGADSVGASWRTQPGDTTIMAGAIAAALAHPFGIGNARYRLGTDRVRDVDTLQCGCYRRDVFERLGLFDQDLLRSQDSELTFRVLRAGGRVLLVPGVVATYYARVALDKLWRMFFQYGYFKPLVARKVGAVMTARQLVPALFVFTVGLAAVFAPWFGPARICSSSHWAPM